jgi:hypothetical protein
MTKDGIILDSWSEVAVHQALVVAFPEARIEHHVILPGEPTRSADFLIEGHVWVEVLAEALDVIDAPRTERQRKYASQWNAKASCYRRLGIQPCVLQPADVHDPVRFDLRIAAIGAALGREPVVRQGESGRTTRSKGSWTFALLCSAVESATTVPGTFPTDAALAAAGFGQAVNLLKQKGQRQKVAAALRLRHRTIRGSLTRERVVVELVAWVLEHGSYPSTSELKKAGKAWIISAANRLWSGEQPALREEVERQTGRRIIPRQAANGTYATLEKVADAFRPLCVRLGRMPSWAEASAEGLGYAWNHASARWGIPALASHIGVPYFGPRRRTKAEMLHELSSVLPHCRDGYLTTTAIRKFIGAKGITMVCLLGGIAAVRKALSPSEQNPASVAA